MATPLVVLLIVLAALIGAGLSYLWMIGQLQRLREERVRLESELASERRIAVERSAAFESSKGQLADSFSALAAEALKHNSGEFLRLAEENFKQLHIKAQGELGAKEKAVENLVKPIREVMEKTERQIREMEKERQSAYGALSQHLESMAETQRMLQSETRNLVQALRRPEVRGQWGEMTLKRLAELAGMVEHCDFSEQTQVTSDEGQRLRPDMIVKMPDSRAIVVDAKTPLDAYLSAVDADNDEERLKQLQRHARKVRERIKELASKSYWEQFKESPDFVVLFIPGDQFLAAALEQDRRLLEDALAERVILATPTSFVALLRAVAFGWRQQVLAENAEKIREVGSELYGRLATFAEHLSRVGKGLESSVGHFNKAVSSFESRVMPGARKFTEMGIEHKKETEAPAAVEHTPRIVAFDGEEEKE